MDAEQKYYVPHLQQPNDISDKNAIHAFYRQQLRRGHKNKALLVPYEYLDELKVVFPCSLFRKWPWFLFPSYE